MHGFLLDTNVVSELIKRRPHARVVGWVDAVPEELLHLSVITVGEVRRGIELLPGTDPRKAALSSWLERDVRIRFENRLLTFDAAVAERWGQLEAQARRARRTLPTVAAQLAATALHHGLTFATRNTADFEAAGVSLIDPWHE